MTLTRETIRQGVLEVLRDKLHCPAELLAEENWEEPLTGRTFGLTAVDLTYLLLETEKALGVRVPEGCLRDYGFSTLNKIIDGMATTE